MLTLDYIYITWRRKDWRLAIVMESCLDDGNRRPVRDGVVTECIQESFVVSHYYRRRVVVTQQQSAARWRQ